VSESQTPPQPPLDDEQPIAATPEVPPAEEPEIEPPEPDDLDQEEAERTGGAPAH
jgi:hypothetical protein